MKIEYPEDGPLEVHRGRLYWTIGHFYKRILSRFEDEPELITGENQNTYSASGVDIWPIRDIDGVRLAIKTIKEQGEGTHATPYPDDDPSKPPAHYYRFGEMYHQQRIAQTLTGWDYSGPPLPFPPTLPIAKVPHSGYHTEAALEFDTAYSRLVDKLQTAVSTADNAILDESVDDMKFVLAPLGKALMRKSLPHGGGNYCPCFRYRSS